MTDDHVNTPEGEARRALVLHNRPLVVDLITLTLNHGGFVVRAAGTLAEAEAILAEWSPNMTVVDMDHDDSTALLGRLGVLHRLTRTAATVAFHCAHCSLVSCRSMNERPARKLRLRYFTPDSTLPLVRAR